MNGRRILPLPGGLPRSDVLEEAVAHLRSGGILAYPTETVYGFGTLADPQAVARLAALKKREPARPFLVLLRRAADAAALAWTPAASELADVFWPGSLTLVLADPQGRFPPGVRSPAGTVAVRVSPHPVVQALLEAVGQPLTSTSANAPGEPPARSGEEAAASADALGAGPELAVLDAGRLPDSPPSTVVDCTGPSPLVVREGTLPLSRLRCVVPAASHGGAARPFTAEDAR